MLLRIFLVGLLLSCLEANAQDYNGMAEAICRDSEHFQNCLSISKEDCLKSARQSLVLCRQTAMPDPPVDPLGLDPVEGRLGAWSVAWGNCAEVAFFIWHEESVKPECSTYFAARQVGLLQHAFRIDVTKLRTKIEKKKMAGLLFWAQFSSSFFPPLVFSMILAFFWWRRKMPEKFPKWFCSALFVPSFLIGFLAGLPYLAAGNYVHGDNPTAMGGSLTALLFLGPFYWIGMYGLYKFLSNKSRSA